MRRPAFKKNLDYDYEKLLKSIEGRMAFFDDYHADEKVFCIRHDEDWSIEYSLELARAEKEYGLTSTYFLNNTCSYFDYSQDFFDKCREIVDLGHRIGLHYNALESYLTDGTPVAESLRRPLDFLRGLGIPVNLGSAHGSRVCRENKVINFEIWKEFETSDLAIMKRSPLFDGDLGFERIPLSSVGFDCDVSLLPHQSYISDSSKRLWGLVRVDPVDPGRVYDLIEYAELMRGGTAIKSNVNEVIEHFNKRVTSGLMHILIHPRWWVEEASKPKK
ncbi:MAG TPA: hypothetical protein VMF90_25760 [Rhizobiaceae bacterium]|nr:hypothetical protein [Rhizobiaceae bacterium]